MGRAAIRAFSQSQNPPVCLVNSNFGGHTDQGNRSPQVSAITLDRGNTTLSADCVFTWGENHYADLLWPRSGALPELCPVLLQPLPNNPKLCGYFVADDHLRYMGSASLYQMLDLFSIATWKRSAGCQ